MEIIKYIDFIKAYTKSLRWLFNKHDLREQIAMIKEGSGTNFMHYLIVTNNYNSVIKRLKKERTKRKLRVCFVVSEPSKWNMQSLYDELIKSELFYPFIVVSNLFHLENRPTYQHILEFYRSVASNVEVGWDEKRERGIDLKKFSPDIVFYQQPSDIYSNQNIPYVSSFALTFYLSYAIEDTYSVAKDHLFEFYLLLSKYFVYSKTYKDFFLSSCPYKISNIVSIEGHPKLDVYADYHPDSYAHKYVIYAPHHSFYKSLLKYGTFPWSGQFILNWAKLHPEINWVFKPHPRFKVALQEEGLMSFEEIESYFSEWDKLGIVYEDGNYFELFKNSRCLITDCGSFLTEYLPTQMPVIHLRNINAKEYSPTNAEIIKSYYKAFDLLDLSSLLDEVILKMNDPLKKERVNKIEELGLQQFHATHNIIKELKALLH